MAADGHDLYITSDSPPEVSRYDTVTTERTILIDPYGTPIDVTVDRHHDVFATNVGKPDSIAMWSAGPRSPREITCTKLGLAEAIATHDEGDVFVNGYMKGFTGVLEFPAAGDGSDASRCRALALKSETAPVGLAIDPKDDALITLDDPDQCAGGIEGLMRRMRSASSSATKMSAARSITSTRRASPTAFRWAVT